MDFHNYTTMRDWTRRSMPEDRFADDIDHFYRKVMADAVRVRSAQFLALSLTGLGREEGRYHRRRTH